MKPQSREQWAGKVHNPDDMVRFVDAVGCCTGKPLPEYPDFPNQSEAIGKIDADSPDVWFWKDDLHAQKRIYYTRLFGGQPGFVSFELLPAFIATNGGVIDELAYNGLLTPEARQIYQIIEENGPVSIKNLKRLLTPDAKRAATKVLHDLDRLFIISKTGITGRTMGTYGYIWDLTERWIPEVLSAADRLGRKTATAMIQEHLSAFGISAGSQFYKKVLGWP